MFRKVSWIVVIAILVSTLTFFAYLVGDRPGSYAERIETATINGSKIELTIRGWAD